MEEALHLIGGLRKIVEKTAAGFEPGVLDITTAERAVHEWGAIERLACAAKLRAAARAEEIGLDAEQAVASASGVTSGQARKQTRLRKKLQNRPKTKTALDNGELSPTQAGAIGDAADADPEAEQSLLDLVSSGASTSDLLKECERIKLEALDREGNLAARQRQLRSVRTWTDGMGMSCGTWRLTPVEGAKLVAELERGADELFRAQVRAKGTVDTPEQRRADALAAMAASCGSNAKRRGPRTVVQLHVTKAAAERGYTRPGEKCQTAAGQPIPMGAVDDALLDPDTKVQEVVFDEVDVRSITSHKRYIPARLRDAMSARGLCCEVPGCGETRGLQRDHDHDFAKGGPTELANLGWKCRYHHDLKTRNLYRLRIGDDGVKVWEPVPIDERRARAPTRR